MGLQEIAYSDSMEQQLVAIYAERDYLNSELGVSDASDVVTMVRNLEAQLKDLYRDREGERLVQTGSNPFRLESTEHGTVKISFGSIKVEFPSHG